MGEMSLKYVIDAIGSDRIIYASDFPHEPSEAEIIGDVPEFLADTRYSGEVKRKILSSNAKALYGIA
jgi:predicted TIM-barrel fold metal-dependent hydrolase